MIIPLENQLSKLESSIKLKKLGFPQKSLFYWVKGHMSYGYEGEWDIAECVGYFIFCEEVGLKPGAGNFNVDRSIGDDDSISYWPNLVKAQKKRAKEVYSAYTVAELGQILKNHVGTLPLQNPYDHKWYWRKKIDTTEAEARAQMIIYLAENNLLTM